VDGGYGAGCLGDTTQKNWILGKMPPAVKSSVPGYAITGAALGVLAGAVYRAIDMGSAELAMRELLLLAASGGIVGSAGAIADLNIRKLIGSGLAGALGAMVLMLVMLLVVQVKPSLMVGAWVIMASFALFAALVALVEGLMEGNRAVLGYSVLMAAAAGEIGFAAGWPLSKLVVGEATPFVYGALYSGCIWTAIALARDLAKREAPVPESSGT